MNKINYHHLHEHTNNITVNPKNNNFKHNSALVESTHDTWRTKEFTLSGVHNIKHENHIIFRLLFQQQKFFTPFTLSIQQIQQPYCALHRQASCSHSTQYTINITIHHHFATTNFNSKSNQYYTINIISLYPIGSHHNNFIWETSQ